MRPITLALKAVNEPHVVALVRAGAVFVSGSGTLATGFDVPFPTVLETLDSIEKHSTQQSLVRKRNSHRY